MSGADHSVASPHTIDRLTIWEPSISDLKQYRHFDAPVKLSDIPSIYSSTEAVLNHRFMPLLEFEKSWRRGPKRGEERKKKIRKIRFACRKDSYLYKHYRERLSQEYENLLQEVGLSESVLAYRSIPDVGSRGNNKTNIEFARDAFETIKSMGKCAAVAIDISKFFDSLDHLHVKKTWARLIGEEFLPEDHYRVYRSIIRYRYISRDDTYVALGYSEYDDEGKLRYLIDPKTIPMQICPLEKYRELVVPSGKIRQHKESYGIPQGLPLSDILANSYLIEFDLFMKKYATEKGGTYMRYSDDILLILPGDGRAARGAAQVAARKISEFGEKLRINADKTEIACFSGIEGPDRCYNLVASSEGTRRLKMQNNEGLSYLGFRFDGRRVFLRNSTISNLSGKIARSCRAAAHAHVRKHEEQDLEWLLENAPTQQVRQQFFHVNDFDDQIEEIEKTGGNMHSITTFWSYSRRAARVFKDWDNRIFKQLRGLKSALDERFLDEIRRSFENKENRKYHEN